MVLLSLHGQPQLLTQAPVEHFNSSLIALIADSAQVVGENTFQSKLIPTHLSANQYEDQCLPFENSCLFLFIVVFMLFSYFMCICLISAQLDSSLRFAVMQR